jgi:hypothetical protein
MNEQRRAELAAFLKTRREQLKPEAVGLQRGTRRRVPGLRRDELVRLMGEQYISLDWYTSLEQARPHANPSRLVLEHLARALLLSPLEKEHLFHLAGKSLLPETAPMAGQPNDRLQAIVRQLDPWPAYVQNPQWYLLAWNAGCTAVFGDFGQVPPANRNIVWLMFMEPGMRTLIEAWEDHAQRIVAQFRASFGEYPADAGFHELIDHLSEGSPLFREWWSRQDVQGRTEGRKAVAHPVAGRMVFDQNALQIEAMAGCELVIYVPLTQEGTATKLAKLVPMHRRSTDLQRTIQGCTD